MTLHGSRGAICITPRPQARLDRERCARAHGHADEGAFITHRVTLPAALARLTQLEELVLDDVPLEDPPPDVVAKGVAAILNYLRAGPAAGSDRVDPF